MLCSIIVVRGVGQWLIRLMEGFFAVSSQESPVKGNLVGEGVLFYMVDYMSFKSSSFLLPIHILLWSLKNAVYSYSKENKRTEVLFAKEELCCLCNTDHTPWVRLACHIFQFLTSFFAHEEKYIFVDQIKWCSVLGVRKKIPKFTGRGQETITIDFL